MANFLDDQTEAKRLAQLLADYDRRLQALERTTQASYTSIEGGSLDIYDDEGVLKGSVGVQPDGGVALVPVNTAPPPTPTPPTVESALAGLVIGWDGLWDDSYETPTDFALVQVHVGATVDFTPDLTTQVATITARLGGTVTVHIEGYDPVWVRLVGQNTAALTGPPSMAVQGQPRQAVEQDLIDGIITEVKIAENAVTEAKIALGAVQTVNISDDAITTPKLLAGAVTTDKLTALSVTAEKIASLAVTTDKLAALSVTADQLAANSVTATKIDAGVIHATHLAAGSITADKLDANAINGKTITGATVQTAASGPRVVMNAANLTGYGTGGNKIGIEPNDAYPYIYWTSGDGTNKAFINVSGSASDANIGINSGTFNDGGTTYRWRTFFGNDFYAAERVVASTGSPVGSRLFLGKSTAVITGASVRAAGVFRADNISVGTVTITPTANTPTSVTLSGGSIAGTSFRGFVTPNTTVPGTVVLGVGCSSVSSAGMTIWLTRTNSTATSVFWMIIGED
jgi:hypothetical protein